MHPSLQVPSQGSDNHGPVNKGLNYSTVVKNPPLPSGEE